MPCAATRRQLVAHDGQHLVDLVGQAADGDTDQAGVGVVAREREDGVGQAAALADLLEQPARGAAAEGGVEHAEREPAVVVAGQALHAEHQVDLLEAAGSPRPSRRARADPPAPWRGGTRRSSPARKPLRANAAATRRTTSAWSTLPATATTMFSGR